MGRSWQEDDRLKVKTEESEGVNIMEIWEIYVLIRRSITCKGPEVDMCLESSRTARRAGWLGTFIHIALV